MLARSVAAAALALSLGACVPITARNGFQAVEAQPREVVVGEDTRSTVQARLGSPSATSAFPPQVWYYVSQTTERTPFRRPRVTQREVVAITFDEAEKVASVNAYGLEAGRVIAYNTRTTPTRGRELSILEQLLGNVGRGATMRDEEADSPEGRRRRDD